MQAARRKHGKNQRDMAQPSEHVFKLVWYCWSASNICCARRPWAHPNTVSDCEQAGVRRLGRFIVREPTVQSFRLYPLGP
jgi:hypothetical protein